jgi:hypothetical protein
LCVLGEWVLGGGGGAARARASLPSMLYLFFHQRSYLKHIFKI